MNSHMLLSENPRVVFIFIDVSAVQTHTLCSCSFNKSLSSTHCVLAILLGPMEDYKNDKVLIIIENCCSQVDVSTVG